MVHFVKISTSEQAIIQSVQHNCDISDANFAGNYTLCIYLLKMREYYRWEKKLAFDDNFEKKEMTNWLRNREKSWDQIIDDELQPVVIGNKSFDPFAINDINQHLENQQLFYHAGIGRGSAQHFFVAELLEQQFRNNIRITICGKEYARDLTSPPAMFNGEDIIIRSESLKRILWERYQEWHWHQNESSMGKALTAYPFEHSIADALDEMVAVEQNTLIQHELGEMEISKSIGQSWPTILINILGTKAELLARAVRDHLADCESTLPFLIRQNNNAAIHFYFANLSHLRKQLFPAVMSSYEAGVKNGGWLEMSELLILAASHWTELLNEITALDSSDNNLQKKIVSLCESASL